MEERWERTEIFLSAAVLLLRSFFLFLYGEGLLFYTSIKQICSNSMSDLIDQQSQKVISLSMPRSIRSTELQICSSQSFHSFSQLLSDAPLAPFMLLSAAS